MVAAFTGGALWKPEVTWVKRPSLTFLFCFRLLMKMELDFRHEENVYIYKINTAAVCEILLALQP